MFEISDAMLQDYDEGRLSPEQRAQVEAALALDPDVRWRLDAIIATRLDGPLADELRAVFGGLQPTPAHQANFVMNYGKAPTVSAPLVSKPIGRGPDLLARLRDFLFPAGSVFGPAMAYAGMLAVGVVSGWIMHGASDNGAADVAINPPSTAIATGGIVADAGLTAALGSQLSGPLPAGAHSGQIVPTSTFRSKQGAVCRQYAMAGNSETDRYGGVACRDASGSWIVKAHAALAPPSEKTDVHVRAATGPGHSAVEAQVDELIGSDLLTHEEEKKLISRGWK
jgi:hypothetical protein